MEELFLQVDGFCPICERNVIFQSKFEWLRDHFLCSHCGSIPRERALMQTININYPDYRNLKIHESSPVARGASLKLRRECTNYSASHYYKDVTPGLYHPIQGYRCEDLENLTFADEEFDLFVTQDVMEHIFEPEKAFSEIARRDATEGRLWNHVRRRLVDVRADRSPLFDAGGLHGNPRSFQQDRDAERPVRRLARTRVLPRGKLGFRGSDCGTPVAERR